MAGAAAAAGFGVAKSLTLSSYARLSAVDMARAPGMQLRPSCRLGLHGQRLHHDLNLSL
jgi:hypothetical protein